MAIEAQLAVPLPIRRFVSWMMATQRLAASAEFLVDRSSWTAFQPPLVFDNQEGTPLIPTPIHNFRL